MELIREIAEVYVERADWFAELAFQHFSLAFTAIFIAGVSGLVIGIVIAEREKLSSVVLGIINVFYTVPAISLLGMLIPFLGIGNNTAVVALTIYALMPMVRNTCTGIRAIDKDIIEAAKGMGSTWFQILYKIKLPLAMSVIIAGLRSMVVMTISVGSIAAFIGAGGLGVAVYRGISVYNEALTFAGSILIAAMAIIFDLLLGCLEKYFKRKRRMK